MMASTPPTAASSATTNAHNESISSLASNISSCSANSSCLEIQQQQQYSNPMDNNTCNSSITSNNSYGSHTSNVIIDCRRQRQQRRRSSIEICKSKIHAVTKTAVNTSSKLYKIGKKEPHPSQLAPDENATVDDDDDESDIDDTDVCNDNGTTTTTTMNHKRQRQRQEFLNEKKLWDTIENETCASKQIQLYWNICYKTNDNTEESETSTKRQQEPRLIKSRYDSIISFSFLYFNFFLTAFIFSVCVHAVF